ncbi:MAG TPA: hypothetical protein VIN67_10725 [Desulfobaccales bacterium]
MTALSFLIGLFLGFLCGFLMVSIFAVSAQESQKEEITLPFSMDNPGPVV